MPVIHGPIGFRAGGGGTTVLGEPPTVNVVLSTVSVEVQTPTISVDVATGEIEVIIP